MLSVESQCYSYCYSSTAPLMGIPLNNEGTTCIQHSNKHTNNSVSDTKKRKRKRERERERGGGGGGEGEEVVKHVTIHISVQQVYNTDMHH